MPITTADLIAAILNAPQPHGINIDGMRKTGIILNALETAKDNDAVLLDEAHWSYLNAAICDHSWSFYSPAFIEVTDDVVNAKKIDPNTRTIVQPSG